MVPASAAGPLAVGGIPGTGYSIRSDLMKTLRLWWGRLREHRFWGLTFIAWWLIIQGGFFILMFSFALVGGTNPNGLVMVAMPGVVCVVAGMQVRTRHPLGWWSAVIVFGFELSTLIAGNISTVFDLFLTHNVVEGGRVSFALRLFWQDILIPALLSGFPLLYLTRPKVRQQFFF